MIRLTLGALLLFSANSMAASGCHVQTHESFNFEEFVSASDFSSLLENGSCGLFSKAQAKDIRASLRDLKEENLDLISYIEAKPFPEIEQIEIKSIDIDSIKVNGKKSYQVIVNGEHQVDLSKTMRQKYSWSSDYLPLKNSEECASGLPPEVDLSGIERQKELREEFFPSENIEIHVKESSAKANAKIKETIISRAQEEGLTVGQDTIEINLVDSEVYRSDAGFLIYKDVFEITATIKLGDREAPVKGRYAVNHIQRDKSKEVIPGEPAVPAQTDRLGYTIVPAKEGTSDQEITNIKIETVGPISDSIFPWPSLQLDNEQTGKAVLDVTNTLLFTTEESVQQ